MNSSIEKKDFASLPKSTSPKKMTPYYFRFSCIVLFSSLLLTSCKIFGSAPSSGVSGSDNNPLVFPAAEFYGERWNSEHVRLNSDPRPSGTVMLILTPPEAANFVMPVCGNILSEFGMRNGRMHTGIDIRLTREQPVYSAFDGVVRMAKMYGNYGNVVVVRHYNGLETLYSHLNSLSVVPNQQVKAGDRIGGGGRTGNATTDHLHFEIRFMGEPLNPRLVIDFEKCILNSNQLTINN